MIKKIFKIILSQFLFMSIMLITSIKKAFGEGFDTWDTTSFPSGVAPEPRISVTNILNAFILSPLLILGLLFYSIYFYKRIRKKDKDKRIKWFKRGTVAIVIYILLYVVLIIYNI